MTRLTDAQKNECITKAADLSAVRGGFVSALIDEVAALAVQEVERERAAAHNAFIAADRLRAESRKRNGELTFENATLTAQLAEVTKERDAYKQHWDGLAKDRDAAIRERDALRAQLATAKREAKRDALTKLALESEDGEYVFGAEEILLFRDREYPATPSGELFPEPDFAPAGTIPATIHATPSPEAREVPEDVVVRVETRRGIGWYSNGETIVRITPADAKRIVAMAQEAE